MSFIDAKNILGTIHVSEYADNGEYRIREVPARYVVYEEDPVQVAKGCI